MFIKKYFKRSYMSKRILAKDAVEFMILNVLVPLNIEVNSKVFNMASQDEDGTVLEEMQFLILNFVSKVFLDKKNSRNWLKSANVSMINGILENLGLKSRFLSVESSSRDSLICFLYLLSLSDSFQALYDPLLPPSESYIEPYGIEFKDKPKGENQREFVIEDQITLLNTIDRVSGQIMSKIHVLGDLEFEKERLLNLIREIDPNTPISSLILKASPNTLEKHTASLTQAIQRKGSLRTITENERVFWKWASTIIEKKNEELQNMQIDVVFPVISYPRFTKSPCKRIARKNEKIISLKKNILGLLENLSKQNINIEDDNQPDENLVSFVEKAHNLVNVGYVGKSQRKVSLLPDLNQFNEKKLYAIIQKSDHVSKTITETSEPIINEAINSLCKKLRISAINYPSEC